MKKTFLTLLAIMCLCSLSVYAADKTSTHSHAKPSASKIGQPPQSADNAIKATSPKGDISPDKKPDKKPDTKPDKKPDKQPDMKPDQQPDQQPASKPDKKPDKQPASKPDKAPASK